MSSLIPGSRLGPYEILTLIGAGGMGQVWKARDTRLDRIVAIKVAQEKFSERFGREARTVAALNHPHICSLFDVGPDYLVMEYIEGQPLEGPLPLDQTLKYAAQICDALDAAHKKHIVHRDLKPGNILVTKSGVKLLDFGLAKTSAADPDVQTAPVTPVTEDGLVMGTLQYMSPEQLDGKKADARSDIYSLGLVLYEMVTGKRAFPQTDLAALQPPDLERVVKTCLAKDPDARWQTAREVRLGLEWSAGSGTAAAVAIAPARSLWRERTAWIVLAATLLAALLFSTPRQANVSSSGYLARFAVAPPEGTVFAGQSIATVPVPQFALSPDGRALVFAAAAVGSRPTLRQVDTLQARPLPGTENPDYPFWSFDNQWIAFFSEGKLKRIPAEGGAVTVVADRIPSDPRGGSWGPDGTILFGTGGSGIHQVSTLDGRVIPLTELDSSREEGSHRWPNILPDSRHFVFTVRSGLAEQRGIYLGSLDGKTKKLLVPVDSNGLYATPGYLLYLENGTLFAQAFDANGLELSGQPFTIADNVGFSSNGNGAVSASHSGTLAYSGSILRNGRLLWLDRGGGPLDSVALAEGDYSDFRLSPDEKWLIASLVDPRSGAPGIWRTDLTRASSSPFTLGAFTNATPVWSPEGAQVVFRTNRKGLIEFYQKSAGGGGEDAPVLLEAEYRAAGLQSVNLVPWDWSRDGRHILFSVSAPGFGIDLWLLPLADGKPVNFLRWPADQLHGNFSPDGRLVAYSSDESGRFEVYAETFPRSDWKQKVSTNGGYEPRWRNDGGEIYYLSEDRKLMVVSVGPSRSFGVPTPLFQTRVPPGVSSFRTHYVPSRDGKRFLINTQTGDTAPLPITVVLNWTAELNK